MKNISENIVGLAKISIQGGSSESPYASVKNLENAMKAAILSTGIGLPNPDSPFSEIIKPGMSVLLKPNWVLHFNKSGLGMDCMVTHPAFLEAIVGLVALAKPSKIIVGDAPIQSADFNKIVTPELTKRLTSVAGSSELEIRDFRNTVCVPNRLSLHTIDNSLRSENSSVLFDLGRDSLLEPISNEKSLFRVTSYNHEQLRNMHHPGKHHYRICREVFENDVIINLPKLKTHKKAGLTAALKNMVGVNGNKDYLPHHRSGGGDEGGDCYPERRIFKHFAEHFLDKANKNINKDVYLLWQSFSYISLQMNKLIHQETELEGSWYGNDTIWRMILDLNRIVLYGKSDGTLSDFKQRTIFSITDAIVAGEGCGPLAPEPKFTGLITFASSSSFADLVHSSLMRFDWQRIPHIRNAFNSYRYPLSERKPADLVLCHSGQGLSLKDFETQLGSSFKPSNLWLGHIEV